jgi:CRP/FNR family transcriptional regulator, cyclic AMP receptor protein
VNSNSGCCANTSACRLVSRSLGNKKSSVVYEPGSVLYREGEPCDGIFHLCRGKVKLIAGDSNGRTAILKIARNGELLGVAEAVLNRPFLSTAEIVETSAAVFVPRDEFIQIFPRNSHAGIDVVKQLSLDALATFASLRALRLSRSTSQRLAGLILQWTKSDDDCSRAQTIELPYTHAQMGQMIGCSRETVTRLLNGFQRKGIATVRGRSLVIHDLSQLQSFATD